jgi:hypothetical protein
MQQDAPTTPAAQPATTQAPAAQPATPAGPAIRRGKNRRPPRLVVYGTHGIGKSTFANDAPNSIFITTEDGLGEIDVKGGAFPLSRTVKDVLDNLKWLAENPHDFQTVVLDTGDWYERMVHEDLCRKFHVSNIVKVDGGYGKGYDHAVGYFRELTQALDYLRDARGMASIILAHAHAEKIEDPENASYDCWTMKMHKKAAAYLSEWSDAVLFAHRRMITRDPGDGRNIAVGVGQGGAGDRILRANGKPTVNAKNRLGLPDEFPFSWQEFVSRIK